MVKVQPNELVGEEERPSTRSDSRSRKCGCCARLKFYWKYHVVYFFKTLCRKNPDTFTGYELFLIDRFLYRVVPLTYSTQRIGCFQKIFILAQLVWAIFTAVKCYQFHVASLQWIHDSLYTLWEFILWIQFPVFIFFHTLSVKFKTGDKSWLHLVRAIVWFLLFLTILVIVATLSFVSDFPLGLMETDWEEKKEFLYLKGHRPGWIINMQRPLECCGFREPSDWIKIMLPYTCCPTTTYKRNCTLKHSFHEGCLWRVKELYQTCKPIMWQGAVVNALVLVVNYGLFRYLFKRNHQGWQVDLTWHETLLPVLRYENSSLPTKMKKPHTELVRMTESEAILDIMQLVQQSSNKDLKAKADEMVHIHLSNAQLANI